MPDSLKTKTQIEDTDNEIFISIVSIWEIDIKTSLGKLKMAIDFPSTIIKIEENGFVLLPIFPENTVCVASLPFQLKDSFDRILIAQTIVEKLKIISKDDIYDTYGINWLW